ncbi:MAG: hypothetical protein IMY85_00755 [Chloroflexi bacterium]|nr:hypothetical protein [Chloroflexota bacterium]
MLLAMAVGQMAYALVDPALGHLSPRIPPRKTWYFHRNVPQQSWTYLSLRSAYRGTIMRALQPQGSVHHHDHPGTDQRDSHLV